MQNWLMLLWVLIPAYTVLLWVLVAMGVSRISGWHVLAGRFRAQSPFSGPTWKWRSAQMRSLMGYGNCLTLGSGPQGLYLDIIWVFRFCHPPLLIPWNEITLSRRRLLFFECVRFELGRDLRIPLWIRVNDAERIQQAAGSYWPAEQAGTYSTHQPL